MLIEPPNTKSPEETRAFVESFSFWYQKIYLGHGIYSKGEAAAPAYHERVWEIFKKGLPGNLNNASVLDVGCNAGYFSIQAKLLGAGRVLGIEPIAHFLKQAEGCCQIWGGGVELRQLDAHRLSQIQEKFDLIIFTAILYHLKNPLQVIEEVGRLCNDTILVETEVIKEDPRNTLYVSQGSPPKVTETHQGFMKLIEGGELNADPSNWWIPDTECVLGMLRIAGFKYFSTPVYTRETRLLLAASKKETSLFNLGAK